MIAALRQRLRTDRRTRLIASGALLLAFVVAVQGLSLMSASWRLAYDKAAVPCLPYRAYLIHIQPIAPVRGDIVSFKTRGLAPIAEDGTVYTKMVLGLPGELVAVDAAGATVGGRRLPFTQRALTRLKTTGAALARTYRLGPGEYFMAGTTPRAYDSRYYGPVHADQLLGSARPLW